jgi:DNA primase large subunit
MHYGIPKCPAGYNICLYLRPVFRLDVTMSDLESRKRKRSLHDTPVDLTKMQLAKLRLHALQEELSGIEETTEEMDQILVHLEALQDILGTTKKLVHVVFIPGYFPNMATCRNSDFPPYRTTISNTLE